MVAASDRGRGRSSVAAVRDEWQIAAATLAMGVRQRAPEREAWEVRQAQWLVTHKERHVQHWTSPPCES